MSIKSAIEKSDKNQAQIARELSVDPSAVNGWASGRFMPTASNLSKLSALLGCTVDELLREEKEEA